MPNAYSGMGFWECHGFGFWVAGDSMMRVRFCRRGPRLLSAPTALDSTHTACAKESKGRSAAENEAHKGLSYLHSQCDAPSRSLIKPERWKHVEVYVMYNRIAAALSAFAIFACWAAGIWAVVAHF